MVLPRSAPAPASVPQELLPCLAQGKVQLLAAVLWDRLHLDCCCFFFILCRGGLADAEALPVPSAAEEGFPLCSPAKICSQIPANTSLLLSKANWWGLMSTERAGATGEQRNSSWCSPATLWVPSQSCSCSSSLCRCLISFRPCSVLHLKPQECSAAPVWLQCCAHSLIPDSCFQSLPIPQDAVPALGYH